MQRTWLIVISLIALSLVLSACNSSTSVTSDLPSSPSDEDIQWLATVIASEAGSIYDEGQWVKCTDEERYAVGWTVINRLNAGTYGKSIKEIATSPNQYAHNQQPNSEITELAKGLLDGKVSDATGGATHFFSPISMPKEGEDTTGFDTGGGLYDVTGISKKVYFPSWTKTMVYVGDLDSVRKAYFMFYRTAGATTPQPSTTPATSSPTSSTSEVVQVSELTPFDIADRIYDTRLSESQRREIWQQAYQGARVSWYVQLHYQDRSIANIIGYATDVKEPGTESTIGLVIRWASGEYSKDIMTQAEEGSIFIMTGTLVDYYPTGVMTGGASYSRGFKVEEAKIDTLVLKYIWERDAIHEGVSYRAIVAVDQRYIYSWDLESPGWYYEDRIYDWVGEIYTFDKTNGYFVSEIPFKYSTTHAGFLQSINDKITSMSQGQLVFAQHEFPFQTSHDGFTFVFYGNYGYYFHVDCYEPTTNSFLWGLVFDRGYGNTYNCGALVLDRTIFISKGTTIQAYQLQ